MFALDHFDFYYGPMFGKQRWPSIRLGLLSPNKYVAIVNTFSQNWEANDLLLSDLGTQELLPRLIGTTAVERIEQKRLQVEWAKLKQQEESLDSPQLSGTSSEVSSSPQYSIEDRISAASLQEFQPSAGARGLGEIQLGKRNTFKDHLEFEVTDYEGMNAELPVRPHFIYYPRQLRVRTYDRGSFQDYPPPLRDAHNVPGWWLLDGGSIVPVLALGLEEGERVLDVCAAPGGKSLAIILTGLPGKVVCNDAKLSRLGVLRRGLSTYIPSENAEGLAHKITLKRKDATDIRSWDELQGYDKVLADVPCTSDRLAVSHDEGNLFAAKNTNLRLSLPEKQTKILINSFRAVCVGGSVVYSTCTLSPAQNEAVVENAAAIARERFGIEVVEESLSTLRQHLTSSGLFRFSESCQRGILLLPFLPSNFGPMFICKFTRLK